MTAPLFTPADLAEMRALNEANLPHSGVIQSAATSSAGGGETTTVWSTVATEPCRLSPATPAQEQLTAGAVREIKDFYVVFAQDVVVSANNRVTVTHDIPGLSSPVTLEVTGVAGRSFEMLRKVTATIVAGLP